MEPMIKAVLFDLDGVLVTTDRYHFGRKRFWPADPWRVIEDEVASGNAEAHEAVFALSNGFIGLRGTPSEETSAAF